MVNRLLMFFDLFRKGNELADVEKWKDRGNAVTILTPLLVTLAKLAGDFGYGIQLTAEEAANLAFGIVAIVQFVLHNITSRRAGLLPAKQSDSPSGSESQF